MGRNNRAQGYEKFSYSTQLSMKFWMLKSIKKKFSIFQAQISLERYDNKYWHFDIYEQEKFHAQLSSAWKYFYNLGAWLYYGYIIIIPLDFGVT